MVGWDNVTTNDVMGTNQLATDEFAVFNSSKTSPGAAKTFNNRPASELEGRRTFSTGIDGGTFSMWVLAEAGRVSGHHDLGQTARECQVTFRVRVGRISVSCRA